MTGDSASGKVALELRSGLGSGRLARGPYPHETSTIPAEPAYRDETSTERRWREAEERDEARRFFAEHGQPL